jgi:hypothetical protein
MPSYKSYTLDGEHVCYELVESRDDRTIANKITLCLSEMVEALNEPGSKPVWLSDAILDATVKRIDDVYRNAAAEKMRATARELYDKKYPPKEYDPA